MSELSEQPLAYVSLEQRKAILDFMRQHVDFAKGSLRTLEARNTSKKLWNDLTKILNSCRLGAKKTADGWSKYWSYFKNKLKNKVNMIKKLKRLGGTASKLQVRPLTKLEKKALQLLGPEFEKKSWVKRTADICPNVVSNHLSTVVKLETSLESPGISFNHNDWPATESKKSDKISVSEVHNDSNGSEESDKEFVADTNGPFEEPVIHGVYPKWLVDIEKKRAEADYIRAKADERRAAASAKHAEAALIQAEALKKLAAAAHTQAEAVMKIAVAFENRSKRDDLLVI